MIELIARLNEKQDLSGEFKTYAQTRNGSSWYIGKSPFVTATIAWLLLNIEDETCKKIVKKSIDYLESLDDTDKRVYKFWYGNPVGTDYPDLPYDMDDTALVNIALFLSGRQCVNRALLNKNMNDKGKYYTWLLLFNKTMLLNPAYYHILFRQLKAFKIFIKNRHNPRMAHYHDTELIVRLNIYALIFLMGGSGSSFKNEQIPFLAEEVEKELTSSLHYMHVPVYYLTVARFQYHANLLGNDEVSRLSSAIRMYMQTQTSEHKLSDADAISLYLSFSLLGQLDETDMIKIHELVKASDNRETPFYFCVGNKHFEQYHTYYSSDITEAMKIRLLANMKS